MDAGHEPGIHTVVGMFGTQLGKTQAENNILGFHIDHDPCPILLVYPTVERGQDWSKERLAPMLRDTPCLQGKVKPARSRDSENTMLHKAFPGGHLSVVGSNAPSGLAQRPIRIVIGDEVDRFAISAGTEGDPIALAEQRMETFWNSLLFLIGSPTVKGASRIEVAWDASDKRRFHVDCPGCGHEQHLRWKQVQWPSGQPEAAAYICESCGVLWTDGQRHAAVQAGRWRAAADFTGTAGFHLNSIYSPWVRLGRLAEQFVEAKKLPDTLQVFCNTKLAETWELLGQGVESTPLMDRREVYDPESLPEGILVITAGVDVQDDRVEIEVVGWGPDFESWSIEYLVIYGDPALEEFWGEVADALSARYRVGEVELGIAAAGIDSGGHFTDEVYRFCKGAVRRRWWAVKGMGGEGRAVWPKQPARNNRYRTPRFDVGVDSVKETLYQRLNIETVGPGFCHFPDDYEQGYFDGLTSETCVTKWAKGRPRREWVTRSGRRRNEPLDCRVYAMAALIGLNPHWPRLMKRRARRKVKVAPEGAGAGAQETAAPAEEQAGGESQAPQDTSEAPRPVAKRKRKPRRAGGWVRGGRRGDWI